MPPDQIEAFSLLLVYSGLTVYLLAFVSFAIDLSRRSGRPETAAVAGTRRRMAASAESGSGAAGWVRAAITTSPRGGVAATAEPSQRERRCARVGTALTTLAWVVHGGGAIARGLAAGHVPWSNLYEFAMVGTLVMVGVFLAVGSRRDITIVGTFITGLAVLLLGLATVNFYVPVTPLAVPLQSPWLAIHVAVALLATGLFALGAALSVAQLLSQRGAGESRLARLVATFPEAGLLERLAARVIILGFVFWTFTLIAGALWAERAWGRYWGWDTKEVWTFVIWTLYAGYLHARATRGWRGSRSAWLAIVAFASVLFNFTVVNVFFAGWHAYSGL